MMLVVPLIGSAVDKAVRLMVDPVGARSGTFSQATVRRTKLVTTAPRANAQRKRDIMKAITIIVPMKLAGQASRSPRSQQGYAMAALLVAMSIMALMMTVVMPVWKHAHACGSAREGRGAGLSRGFSTSTRSPCSSASSPTRYPPNVDVLVEQRFLRKKFKDPITNDDFVLLPAGAGMPGVGLGTAGQRGTGSATTRSDTRCDSRSRNGVHDGTAARAGDRRAQRRARADCPARADRHAESDRRDRGGHRRRDEQEQGSIDSAL